MGAFRIEGGAGLKGEIRVDTAKNAVLPIMAAAVLSREEIWLDQCPDISDVRDMMAILRTLGCEAAMEKGEMRIAAGGIHNFEMPEGLSKQIRSSIFLLGPILARFKKATVTYPGGCEIGLRPIDLHLQGLKSLGVVIKEEGGKIFCDGSRMYAGKVHFDYPSVGATENVMMAAVLLKGETVIHNAAREPEIADLQGFINKMGGRVRGAGTHTIVV